MLNPELRRQHEATLKQPGQKPTSFSKFYVVHHMDFGSFSSWYLVGTDDRQIAETLVESYKKKCLFVAIVEEYPYEIMIEWAKKEDKKKKKE